MRTTRPIQPASVLLWLAVAALLVLIAVVVCRPAFPARDVQPTRVNPAATNVSSASVISNAPTTPLLGSPATTLSSTSSNFQLRPFAVAKETATHQWTDENGRDTNIIRRLSHNELEYQRMVEENSRIFRRQLVYLKEPAAAVFEQAKLTGQQVQQLTLPGVDGQEHQFKIVKTDGKGSSRQGMFSGHLVGNNDSIVTLAFMDGREAFTILSPKENIFIVGEPREDGQVIVKVIDPNTYGVGPMGDDAIINTNSNKK